MADTRLNIQYDMDKIITGELKDAISIKVCHIDIEPLQWPAMNTQFSQITPSRESHTPF